MKRKLVILAFVLLSNLVIVTPVWALANEFCSGCHLVQYNNIKASKHSALACETCHEGAEAHFYDPQPKDVFPEVHFDMEVCRDCHPDQYNTFRNDSPGRTFYGGSDDVNPPKGWSKTLDFPYWNALIDGHPSVLETYEDRAMKWSQIDARRNIRPKSEACLECHGTKVAYYMGINYTDDSGSFRSYPARERTTRNEHNISTGTAAHNDITGAWDPGIITLTVPAGTKVSSYIDAVNEPRYQVKSIIRLPDGRIYASYNYPGATATGVDSDGTKAREARNWIYAAFQALAFDGLDYAPDPADPFNGSGYNWPSVESGVMCNYCHDPMSTKLRIIKKSLIEAIARNGINPYSPTGSRIRDFSKANRQDQIMAVCAQCHSEYVGDYSAVDRIDRDYSPWAKPAEVEILYANLFNNGQDWIQGTGFRPWQTANNNSRGYYPHGSLYPIKEPLIKSQYPETEVFWNSVMYRAGATCTDCHTATARNSTTGRNFTGHSFTSPVKLLNSGINTCGNEACHLDVYEPPEILLGEIRTIQDTFFNTQNETQLALADALKAINQSRAAGNNVDRAVQDYRKALLRWEYYAVTENSMGFHNRAEALDEVEAALSIAHEIKNMTGTVKPIGPCTTISEPGTYVLIQDLTGKRTSTCFFITSSDVIFDGAGHTLRGSGMSKGVLVYNSAKTLMNVTVKNLNVTGWRVGINYMNIENGRIDNNSANLNTDKGIEVEHSSNNIIINNTANLNIDHGIEIEYSSNNNTIANNIANRNFDHGIEIDASSNNTITNNTANWNSFAGIQLEWSSNDNSVIRNNLNWNDWGIYIEGSGNNTMADNTANGNNMMGIYLEASSGNALTNNTALDNGNWDFYSEDGSIDNIVTSLNINHTISFTGKDIAVKATSSPASDPEGYRNINKYIQVERSRIAERETGYSDDSWIALNISYADNDVIGLDESSLRMWKYNGSWSLASGTNGVETERNYVYANISEFGIFAPMAEPYLPAIVDVKPDILNKASKSDKNAITVYIEIPGYDVNAINVSTIILSTGRGSLLAQRSPTYVSDYDFDGIPDRMVKFEKQSVMAIADTGDKVEIIIRGRVGGAVFKGSDHIKITDY